MNLARLLATARALTGVTGVALLLATAAPLVWVATGAVLVTWGVFVPAEPATARARWALATVTVGCSAIVAAVAATRPLVGAAVALLLVCAVLTRTGLRLVLSYWGVTARTDHRVRAR